EVISKCKKIIIIFEGRDAAGKDGTIKTVTKHLSPRDFRTIALPKPSERERSEWYFQRYVSHLPASGEMVFFNRSWYNRLGVEKVMGFCTQSEYDDFFEQVKHFEKTIHHADLHILKYYLDIDREQQKSRLEERETNPLKQWKISPIDKVALQHWDDYTQARNAMLERTNFKYAPWYVVDANNKDDAHIAIMNHIANQLEYKNKLSFGHFNELVQTADEFMKNEG
ncbi:polyphosphate kinase 2, partial [bacterium]|nr:polyphosphate kinase 2 [bacterium]